MTVYWPASKAFPLYIEVGVKKVNYSPHRPSRPQKGKVKNGVLEYCSALSVSGSRGGCWSPSQLHMSDGREHLNASREGASTPEHLVPC